VSLSSLDCHQRDVEGRVLLSGGLSLSWGAAGAGSLLVPTGLDAQEIASNNRREAELLDVLLAQHTQVADGAHPLAVQNGQNFLDFLLAVAPLLGHHLQNLLHLGGVRQRGEGVGGLEFCTPKTQDMSNNSGDRGGGNRSAQKEMKNKVQAEGSSNHK
jgi:hypothetical protein